MRFKLPTFTIFILISILGFSQTNPNDILLTIADDEVLASEFLRVYKKNLNLVQDESQKNVDEYLRLFTNYKLKLKEARSRGLQNNSKYINELATYKQQLAKNYINETNVTKALVEEAYNNITKDVKANHILVRVSQNAPPEDTLAAYKKIKQLRQRTLEEGFENVRKEIHNGKTLFGEELGWFTAFRMVYEFEKMAYATPINKVSKPFRTQFGYHILNVIDTRKARGDVTVKHIMVMDNNTDDSIDTKKRINDIYQKIQQGEEFEALAKEFSDDKNSAPKGGLLKSFASGQLRVPEFEEAAFALQNKGDISKPIKSDFGWHILKLEDKKPIGTFEELKFELEEKIKKDSRSKLIENALIEKLKAKYNVEKTPSLNYFVSILNNDFNNGNWQLPEDFIENKTLITIGKTQLTYQDFGEFLVEYQLENRDVNIFSNIVANAYKKFLANTLKQYAEDNLEFEDEDFAHILAEYRDGLLLFDIMEKTIWQAAKSDTLEVKAYFKQHKDNYFYPVRLDTDVASSPRKKIIKKTKKLLNSGVSVLEIKNMLNTDGKINVIFTSDTITAAHQSLPKSFIIKKGISKIYAHNNGFVVANIKNILPKTPKNFIEVKGLVMSDYQTHKENLWIEQLRQKYNVVINNEVLKHVKAKLKN